MTEKEFQEISNRISSRIYRHNRTRGSQTTCKVSEARVAEDIQILKILSDFIGQDETTDYVDGNYDKDIWICPNCGERYEVD